MEQIISFKSLYSAYRECRRYKRHTANAQRYEMALLDNLFNTQAALQRRNYSPTRSIRFVVSKPKAREIYAADFSDRVVHHWLVPQLEQLFEPVFINDLYSNRKGKGTHQAVKRLQGFMHAVSGLSGALALQDSIKAPPFARKRKRQGWYLQLDIANFFNSVDKPILFQQLQQRLGKAIKQQKISKQKAQALRYLCHVLLKHDATKQAHYRGKPSLLKQVPAHKQLGHKGNDKGLPIGNLTSQFFANVYLNALDQFVKHNLKCKYYIRYVDDFILLADNPNTLLDWRAKIQCFLAQALRLELREIAVPRPIKSGADFLGYITYPHYRLVRRRVVGNLHEKLCHFQRQIVSANVEQGYCLILNPVVMQNLRATLTSYWGHFIHANSYTLRESIFQRFLWLGLLFKQCERSKKVKSCKTPIKTMTIKPCWEPHASQIIGYKSQIYYYRRQYPCANLRVQRGTEQDYFAPVVAGAYSDNNISTSVKRVFIKENGYLKGGLKRRQVYRLQLQAGVELCPYH